MTTINAIEHTRLVDGPVRKIGVQTRSISGALPDGSRYESSLERDFMLLLQFDPLVSVYTPQPLTIKYQDSTAAWRSYTPDGLIEWRKDLTVHDPRPVLVEVKYRNDLKQNWKELKQKFRAARNYAKERNWLFEISTEREIRTPFFDNVRFLLPYKNRKTSAEMCDWILNKLEAMREADPRTLTMAAFRDKWNQAKLIPVVWKLIAERRIGCDLTEPITMNTRIWSIRG